MGNATRAKGWARWSRLIGGWALVLAGLAGFVLPIIPGIPLLLGGLALLAPEYAWARKAMEKVKEWTKRWRDRKKTGGEERGKGEGSPLGLQ